LAQIAEEIVVFWERLTIYGLSHDPARKGAYPEERPKEVRMGMLYQIELHYPGEDELLGE
jgi:hypothetical protein